MAALLGLGARKPTLKAPPVAHRRTWRDWGAELGRELNEALERAELPHVRFHDLRHSTASLLLADGVDMKTVQLILGHSNYQITADTYTHVLPSVLKDAMATMNSIFNPVVKNLVVAPSRSTDANETIQ